MDVVGTCAGGVRKFGGVEGGHHEGEVVRGTARSGAKICGEDRGVDWVAVPVYWGGSWAGCFDCETISGRLYGEGKRLARASWNNEGLQEVLIP